MKRQLKTVVNKLTQNNENKKYLRYYLLQILYSRSNEKLWLIEGEAIEITYNDITVSFTWDMISAVNGKTNKWLDLTSAIYEDDIIEFFESAGLVMPICALCYGGHCPYCDYDYIDVGISYQEAKRINKQCCNSHRDLTAKEIGE